MMSQRSGTTPPGGGTVTRPFLPLSPAVPFREAPAYSKRRRGPAPGNGSGNGPSPSSLSAPRVLVRSNSDTNLTVSQHPPAPLSPLQGLPRGLLPAGPAPRRSPSPQLLQNMAAGSPNGPGRAPGRGQGRNRSPSLSRLGDEARRALPLQRQAR